MADPYDRDVADKLAWLESEVQDIQWKDLVTLFFTEPEFDRSLGCLVLQGSGNEPGVTKAVFSFRDENDPSRVVYRSVDRETWMDFSSQGDNALATLMVAVGLDLVVPELLVYCLIVPGVITVDTDPAGSESKVLLIQYFMP